MTHNSTAPLTPKTIPLLHKLRKREKQLFPSPRLGEIADAPAKEMCQCHHIPKPGPKGRKRRISKRHSRIQQFFLSFFKKAIYLFCVSWRETGKYKTRVRGCPRPIILLRFRTESPISKHLTPKGGGGRKRRREKRRGGPPSSSSIPNNPRAKREREMGPFLLSFFGVGWGWLPPPSLCPVAFGLRHNSIRLPPPLETVFFFPGGEKKCWAAMTYYSTVLYI